MTDLDVRKRLRESGVVPTVQRQRIARVILAEHRHLSADQVYEWVNREGGRVSRATVYNTLHLFASKGLVRELTIDPSRVVYDTDVRPHHHFYHVESGELIDVPEGAVRLQALPELPAGTRADGVEVIIRIRDE